MHIPARKPYAPGISAPRRSRRLLWAPLFLIGLVCATGPAFGGPAGPCPSDCDGDRVISISELVRALRIALGQRPVTDCPAADLDGDGVVGIGELQAAVRNSLQGCVRTFTPTPAPTDTPAATATATGTPTPSPPVSARVCGNGTPEPGEQCDDGNRAAGDDCDAHCRLETAVDPCAGVQPAAGTEITAVRVASGLAQPLYATAPPGDLERLFIVEQRGTIRILANGQIAAAPFLDIRNRVIAGGERGLLGLAFHPSYASNGTFFVYYTTLREQETFSVLSRFRVTENPDVADPESEELVLEQRQPFVAHKGGQLEFDADGYLYVSLGDGGQSATRQNNGQDLTTWLAKILRIDIDAARPYAVPADNPFAGPDGVRDEIWALGFRNPWRFSFDPGTGDMYIGDVGEAEREEINIVPSGESGANFGWCCREGRQPFTRCFDAARTCPAQGLVDPVLEYDHTAGCSVTGGFVYRGCALPALHGTYFYGDYCSGFVRSFTYRGGVVEDERDWTADLAPASGHIINSISGFGRDGRGELYICDLGGEVFKIVPRTP